MCQFFNAQIHLHTCTWITELQNTDRSSPSSGTLSHNLIPYSIPQSRVVCALSTSKLKQVETECSLSATFTFSIVPCNYCESHCIVHAYTSAHAKVINMTIFVMHAYMLAHGHLKYRNLKDRRTEPAAPPSITSLCMHACTQARRRRKPNKKTGHSQKRKRKLEPAAAAAAAAVVHYQIIFIPNCNP